MNRPGVPTWASSDPRVPDRLAESPADHVEHLLDVAVGVALLRRPFARSPGRGPRGSAGRPNPPPPAVRRSAGGCRRSTRAARSSARCLGPGPRCGGAAGSGSPGRASRSGGTSDRVDPSQPSSAARSRRLRAGRPERRPTGSTGSASALLRRADRRLGVGDDPGRCPGGLRRDLSTSSGAADSQLAAMPSGRQCAAPAGIRPPARGSRPPLNRYPQGVFRDNVPARGAGRSRGGTTEAALGAPSG